MKFWKYILTLAAVSLAAVSCVEEQPYEWGEADVEGCYGVYFPVQDASGAHTYDPSMPTEIEFTVARLQTSGAITVPVDYTESHAGIFQVPAAEFADGQSETTIKVTFPSSENGVNYKLSLAINDPLYASKYKDGALNMDFSVLRVEWQYFLNPQTGEPAKFTFNQGWWDEVHTGFVKYYEVNGVRTCQTVTDPTETEDGTVYGFWGTGAAEGEGELNFTWYTANVNFEGKQLVELPVQKVYFNTNYEADVMVYDYYTYWTVLNPQDALAGMSFLDFATKYSETYPLSYYDNGGFYFYTAYYYMPDIGGWNTDSYELVAEAEGFIRVDYSVDVKAALTTEGVVPVTFTLGADVANVKYAVYEGELNVAQLDAKVAAIVDGSETSVAEVAASSTVALTAPATGKYTLVAVSFDKDGKAQSSANTVFTYVAADNPVPVVVTAGIGSAEKYVPSGVSTDTSLEIWVYGEDLVDVKVGVFSYPSLAGDMAGCQDALMKSSSISAENLALANGEGYVDVVTGLVPGTEHYLLVWASNGYETAFAISEGFYTTGDPLPVYKNYSADDINDELLPATSEGYFGTYNYYAVDFYGESPLRTYLGQVTVADSEVADLPADDYGLVTEYVEVSGVFGAEAEYFGFDDTMTMEYYGGVLYQLPVYYGLCEAGYYNAVMYLTSEGKLYGHSNSYTMLGGFVDEGYIAFVDATGSYGFNGWFLRAFSDETYATAVGNMSCYIDILLVDPEVDDNGLAPAPETSSVSKVQLDRINKLVNDAPMNCVETERGRIHSIIDAVKSVDMYDNFLGIKGERTVSSVAFEAESIDYAPVAVSRNSTISEYKNTVIR